MILREHSSRVQQQLGEPALPERVCRGPLLTPHDYQVDIAEWWFGAPKQGRREGTISSEMTKVRIAARSSGSGARWSGLQTELGSQRNVAVLHYAPIHRTVEGEPPEIIPFLGSSRLVEPIDRLGVAAVLHAHAHHGTREGTTPGGIPVYNVSLPVLRRSNDEQPYIVIEVGASIPCRAGSYALHNSLASGSLMRRAAAHQSLEPAVDPDR